MTPVLETPRLWLRPLELADAAAIQELFPHWEVVRYLAKVVPWPYPPDGALCWVRDIALPAVARGEQWHWSLRLKARPDQLIGVINLSRDEENGRGFWLGPAWQGHGLMTEASEVVTSYGFRELGFGRLRVPKALANEGSRRISQKEGMRVVLLEEREFVGGRMLAEVWEITAAEWAARRMEGPGSAPNEPGR